MKAALLKNNGNLIFSDIKRPNCGINDVLIKVGASAICGTDVKAVYRGHRDLKLPRILGHETAGTIAGFGKNVKGFKIGERVQVAPGICCGTCAYCRKGIENMCDDMRIIGFHANGGFAQYLLVPGRGVKAGIINRVPKTLSLEEACLAEPIACCINALTLGQLTKGESVAIFGAGPIGCLLIQLSRAAGASKIILVEPEKKRLEFAARFGADCYINAPDKEVFPIIERKTKGRGVNILIAACSDGKIPGQGIKVLAKRGRIVFFSGIDRVYRDVSVDYDPVHYKELHIIGAYGCSSGQNKEALGLMQRGIIDAMSLITRRMKLGELKQGIAIVKNKKAMKIVINKF